MIDAYKEGVPKNGSLCCDGGGISLQIYEGVEAYLTRRNDESDMMQVTIPR
jgi:hypothetical protein